MRSGGGGIPMIGGEELSMQFIAVDAPDIAQGDLVTMNGKSYRLRDRDRMNCSPDGTLLAYVLREVAA